MNTAVSIVGIVFGAIFLKHWMESWSHERRERMRLIEKAIDSGQLDRQTVEELASSLTGRRTARQRRQGAQHFHRFAAAIGWIGIFVGVAMLVAGAIMGIREPFVTGIIVAVVSFGIVTYPFALRELEARQVPDSRAD